MNELTEEEKEAYEEQLKNTNVKSLLIEQNALLRALYDELTQGEGSSQDQWKCGYCNEVVTDREQHLVESHNSPPDPNPNQDGEFTEV